MALEQPQKLSIPSTLPSITSHWSPKIVASLNNAYEIKIAKFAGEFVWHSHPQTDELFYILSGRMTMRFKEPGSERGLPDAQLDDVEMEEGDILVVSKGVRHCPATKDGMEVVAMLMEPGGVVNTGDAEKTEGKTNVVEDLR
jgi:mannose-6-phosphate isomerase-like protein (cupin superfamily)